MIRVVVIDDSAFARKVLRDTLSAAEGIEVVGHARDGLDAMEQITNLKPDVITLDLVMPELDGVGVLRALRASGSAVRTVVVSMSAADSELAIEALELGAFDLVHKPTALATDRLYEMADELVAKVRAAAAARAPVVDTEPPTRLAPPPKNTHGTRLVALGTSTGGPQALARIFAAFPAEMSVPVVAVVHIPAGYTEALAARIDQASAVHVVEASEGLVLHPGLVVVARAGIHLHVRAEAEQLVCRLSATPAALHRPSVDELFASAAEAAGAGVLAAVLTGMGDDGVIGAGHIRRAGGRVLTESEASCVVYGMPRAIVEAGLSDGTASLERMAAAIVQRL